MVAARLKTAAVVAGPLVVWAASFWFFDRSHFGWWLVPAFGLACIVGFARQGLSDYVRSRTRRDARK